MKRKASELQNMASTNAVQMIQAASETAQQSMDMANATFESRNLGLYIMWFSKCPSSAYVSLFID